MSLVPYWSAEDLTLHLGDCRTVMAGFEAESFDAVVCDPPYDLTSGKKGGTGVASLNPDSPAGRSRIGTGGFMGQSWDATGVAFDPETWRAVYRVMKPGAWLIAFGGTRTWHRLVCAIEDAGFEIRDQVASLTGQDAPGLMWAYGNGFPKGKDVSKAIDQQQRGGLVRAKLLHFAAERGIDGRWLEERGVASAASFGDWTTGGHVPSARNWLIIKDALGVTAEEEAAYERAVIGTRAVIPGVAFTTTGPSELAVTAPATSEAAEWEGWNVALKPAWEPIAVARKPLAGTVAANVLAYGTGALNIGACRVATPDSTSRPRGTFPHSDDAWGNGRPGEVSVTDPAGRWPSNVLFSHSAGCERAGTTVIPGNIRLNPTVVAARANVAKGAEAERRRGARGHGNADGTETVPVWTCQPGCPVAELDRQSGVLTSGANPERRGSDKFRDAYGEFTGQRECVPARGADSGGASRFFQVFRYEAKAGASERPRLPDGTAHPTVKPSELMIWLVKLVSRPGALILDPFAGSGTTGEACLREGRRCVLIEREPKFAELARVRLSKPIQPGMFDMEAM